MSHPPITNQITHEEIIKVAKLSRLSVDESQAQNFADNISKILVMMDVLAHVNTDGFAPLTNVHDMSQRLRDDRVDGNGVVVNREMNQAIAPNVQDGLYLVPQVIE